ncbi:MAG: radical SAM protein [Lentisphaerae bacterium]|nr:radical SAM protein [Lentisphaerota bacterium]MCP4103002.1 radical SAM protein [Lentisphaerota bacterium]
MNRQLLNLLKIILDRKITSVPLKVMRKLRKNGIKRLPDCSKGLKAQLSALKFAKQWLSGERLTRHANRWVLNSFFPPFPSKAFNRMFENMLSGRKFSPVSAYIAIIDKCPFSCRHCSAKMRKSIDFSTGQIKDIISQLHDLGVSVIGLTGGEPLLRHDLCQIIKHASDLGIETVVFTSGHWLTQEYAYSLKNTGLWGVCISLDSSDAESFNKFRNSQKAFSTAISAIHASKQMGLYTMIGAVATPEFVDKKHYKSLYNFAASKNIDELRIVEPMPSGRLRDYHYQFLLNKQQIDTLKNFHQKMNQGKEYTKVCAFNHIESPELLGCGGGTQHMYIDAGGEVCPCYFTAMSFGNVTKEPLFDIWQRMNEAMIMPRRNCFVQTNYEAINQAAKDTGEYPLSPKSSCQLCQETGQDDLPDYFKVVMEQQGNT